MKKHYLTIKKPYLTFISVLTLTFFPLCVGGYQVLNDPNPLEDADVYSLPLHLLSITTSIIILYNIYIIVIIPCGSNIICLPHFSFYL